MIIDKDLTIRDLRALLQEANTDIAMYQRDFARIRALVHGANARAVWSLPQVLADIAGIVG